MREEWFFSQEPFIHPRHSETYRIHPLLRHIISEGFELFEHYRCLRLSRLKDEFHWNVVVAVNDADCSTDLPSPEEELAHGGSDFLNLGRQQDISYFSGAAQQEPFTCCTKFRRPVLGPDDPRPNFPAPGDTCLVGFGHVRLVIFHA